MLNTQAAIFISGLFKNDAIAIRKECFVIPADWSSVSRDNERRIFINNLSGTVYHFHVSLGSM
jgi:hypothetical protein